MAMNGRLARPLMSCSARATTSLPVPVSPMISTSASVGADGAQPVAQVDHRLGAAGQPRLDVVALAGDGAQQPVLQHQRSAGRWRAPTMPARSWP